MLVNSYSLQVVSCNHIVEIQSYMKWKLIKSRHNLDRDQMVAFNQMQFGEGHFSNKISSEIIPGQEGDLVVSACAIIFHFHAQKITLN